MIDAGLYIGYALMFIALAATIVLPLINAIKSPGTLAKSGLAIVVLVVIFLVSYALSDSNVTPKYTALGVGEGSSKLIGAGLIMFYVVFVVAVIGLIYSEINKALK